MGKVHPPSVIVVIVEVVVVAMVVVLVVAILVLLVVVVVVGPYRVFDGGVFANRLFKITGRRSILSIICHELARAAKRIFRREPLSHKK